MKICPQCRAQFEDHMNFCLQDGTPLGEADPSESYNEKTLNLPNSPTLLPTVAAAPPGSFEQSDQPTFQQPDQSTFAQSDQPTALTATPPPTAVYPARGTGSPNSKSSVGLLIGALLGGLLLLGTAVGGVWWFLERRRSGEEVALANTNSQNQSFETKNNSNSSLSNTPLTSGNESETNVNSNNTTKLSTTNSPAVNTSKPTPTPTRKTENESRVEKINPDIEDEPPPIKTPTPAPKPLPKTVSAGVVNGKAVNLVKPAYPAAARAVRASGAVNVQVTIDESGNVISASAVSGHPLLRSSAVQAARASKFSPTILSGQPVKVTGVIIYNFVP